jgi:hypothetical protein
MVDITSENVDDLEEIIFPDRFITLASKLGWPSDRSPPRTLTTSLGNGNDFILQQKGKERWFYQQPLSTLTLVIWNV